MDLTPYKPAAGFFRFYWSVLRENWLRLLGVVVLVEATFAIVYFVVSLFKSEDGAKAMWSYILKHPSIVIGLALLAATWLFLVAVHRKHHSLLDKNHATTPSLELVFDKKKHHKKKGSSRFCIGLRNSSKTTIDHISVILEDIEPLSNKRRLQAHVVKLIGLPLMLGNEVEGHQDVLPTKEFSLHGESEQEIAVVCGEAGGQAMHVFHADYHFGMAVLSSGAKASEARTPASLPPGRYRMVIRAKGTNASSAKRSFIVSLTKRTFTFQPDCR